MKNRFIFCLICLIISFAPAASAAQQKPAGNAPAPPVGAQTAPVSPEAVELGLLLEKKEPKWKCTKPLSVGVVSIQRAPRGAYYRFECRRQELTVLGLVFFSESEQDAARRLEWTLKDPQTFTDNALPLTGLGEKAYQQQRPGFAAVAFHKSRMFAQVSVSINTADAAARPAKLEKLTAEAMKTARRFAGHLAERKGKD